MSEKRKVEIFSAKCPACEEIIELVNRLACSSCEVVVLDMHDDVVAGRAKELGVTSVPSVAIEGRLAACCSRRGSDEAMLREAGLGRAR